MKQLLKYTCLVALIALAGCKTSKDATSSSAPSPKQEAYIQQIAKKQLSAPTLTAKTEVKLQLNDKAFTLNGTLRMKHDEVVQLSLTFFGLEVAKLEFSPESVLVIDRTNKRYARATYDEVSFLREAGLDFYTLQAIFWNELFIPGTKDVTTGLSEFKVQKAGNETLLLLQSKPKLNYSFRTETANARLIQTTVSPKQGTTGVFCNYDNFKDIEKAQFPTHIALGITTKNALGLTLNLSRINVGEDFTTHTQISSRYTQISSEDLLGIISKMMP